MSNVYGRQVVLPLTNKSGGGVIAGDVVVADTSNDGAFTTNTTDSVNDRWVGIAQETIANNATGRVLLAGYAALVNVNASVTRGYFAFGHTVAKQAKGSVSRAAGAFGQYLTTSATPTAVLWGFPDSSSAGGGAPSSAKYITAALDGTLSAEIARPELDDYSTSGATVIAFTSPTTDASVTAAAETDMATSVVFANINTRAHCYVSHALGTGDFDVRMRIVAANITTPHTAASSVFFALYVADSSNTAATRQSLQVSLSPAVTSSVPTILGVTNATGLGQSFFYPRLPIILRIARVGTTVTFYFSENEGRFWSTLGTATASTDFQRVGILGQGGSTGTQSLKVLVHWLRKF